MNAFETVFLFKYADDNWTEQAMDFHNRGFLYGDGVFETMVFKKGKIAFRQFHAERAREGCIVLGLAESGLSNLTKIEVLLGKIWGSDITLRVRWNIHRKGSGKYTPESNLPFESLQIQPFSKPQAIKEKAYLSEELQVPAFPWSHCKTLNSLLYVQANMERKNLGMDEVFLTNTKGYLSEAGSSNLFWRNKNVYYTPSLKSNCIDGVGRRALIDAMRMQNVPIEKELYLPSALKFADQIFTTNATGVSTIHYYEGKEFDTELATFILDVFR
jgi:branched-chain amino acid aminotransferase